MFEIHDSQGAEVTFYDSWVKVYKYKGKTKQGISDLTEKALQTSDLVMITTAHSNVDYSFVQQHAKAILDTKNVMKNLEFRVNIERL